MSDFVTIYDLEYYEIDIKVQMWVLPQAKAATEVTQKSKMSANGV